MNENTPEAFQRHLFTYLVVNGGLFVIDMLTGPGTWFYMPLLIWGFFLGVHAFQVYVWHPPADE